MREPVHTFENDVEMYGTQTDVCPLVLEYK